MPTQKKTESDSSRRQSSIGAQPEQDMTKFMEEIRGMFKDSDRKMSSKLKGMEEKFSSILAELKDEIGEVKTGLVQANTDILNLKSQVDDVENSIEFHAGKVDTIENKQEQKMEELKKDLDEKIEVLNKKILTIEKRERKYNLIFHGIEEDRKEKLYDKMREFFVTQLKIDQERANQIHFSNGHRLQSRNTGPKPIIMRFCYFEDREYILSNAYNLAGTGKRIMTDLPVVMKDERARLAKEAYGIRNNENLKTRIRDVGLDMVLEVRKDETEKWRIRKV